MEALKGIYMTHIPICAKGRPRRAVGSIYIYMKNWVIDLINRN